MKLVKFLKQRIKKNKFNVLILLELVLIAIITLASSYFFDKKFFLFDKSFNYHYVIVMIIALYYGLASGFFLATLLSFAGFALYGIFPFYFFIHAVLIALIAGEFNFYFKIHLDELEAEVAYLEDKLKQIGKATIFTKLSHDNLEKNYLSKPYTLRRIVISLSKREKIEDFLKFLANQFHIDKFALVYKERVYFYNLDNIDFDDELIEYMKKKEEIVYTNEKSKYLAVIPIDNVDNFIVIKEMPFIHFNIENLMAIQFSTEYFFLKLKEKEILKEFKGSKYCEYFSCKSVAEIYRLIELHKKSNTHSSIVLFDIDKFHSEKFENFLNRSLRVLDFFDVVKFKDSNLFLVVLPFTSKEGGLFFVERVLATLEFVDRKTLYQIYEVDSFEKIKTLIEDRK